MSPEQDSASGAGVLDADVTELDEMRDREELRHRHYGLLQELRVLLPGVQILLAFLLTAPFASGFSRADRTSYGIALAAALCSVAAFIGPIALHRFADRRRRAFRLAWGIRLLRIGMGAMGVALLAALAVVVQTVYGQSWVVPVLIAVLVGAGGAAAIVARDARSEHDIAAAD